MDQPILTPPVERVVTSTAQPCLQANICPKCGGKLSFFHEANTGIYRDPPSHQGKECKPCGYKRQISRSEWGKVRIVIMSILGTNTGI